jgi:methylmalonyl-CoA/ethylmalonyl-CoA epimerase
MAASPPTSVTFRLHHVGSLVADLAASASALAKRLGYVVCTGEIVDAAQTARVQFLRLPGADHWLELVTADGENSKLANALGRGVTLHHLCYEVTDLPAAVKQLREGGMLEVGAPTPAAAFGGRRIAWMMDRGNPLVELVEAGPGPLSLRELDRARETEVGS